MPSPTHAAGSAVRPAVLVGAGALSGALHALALPPFDRPWLAFVALVPFLLTQRAAGGAALRVVTAAVFGLVSVVGVIHWVPSALVLANGFGPVDAAVLSAGVFGYYTAFFVLFALLLGWMEGGRVGWPWAPVFAWGAMEGIRDALVPGLAWTSLAHSQHDALLVAQAAEWLGVEGLSLAVVLVDALIAEAVWAAWRREPRWRIGLPAVAGAAVVTLLVATGWLRLGAEDRLRDRAEAEAVRVAAVQIAVPQAERWRPADAWSRVEALLAETRRAAVGGARLVVWPETAIELHLDDATQLDAAVAATLADRPDTMILAGAPRVVSSAEGPRYFNSAVLLDAGGRRVGLYDKVLLYPGSEYVPGWVLALPGARRVLESQLRWAPYTPGTLEESLRAGPLSLGILVCAEGVVAEPARARARAGATVLVQLANDAVLEAPAAAAQHFAIARLRAVETRRPLVRASNRGVNAVVAASGRIVARSPADRAGTAAGAIVPRSDVTWATRSAWLWPWLCTAVVGVAGGWPVRRRAANASEV